MTPNMGNSTAVDILHHDDFFETECVFLCCRKITLPLSNDIHSSETFGLKNINMKKSRVKKKQFWSFHSGLQEFKVNKAGCKV